MGYHTDKGEHSGWSMNGDFPENRYNNHAFETHPFKDILNEYHHTRGDLDVAAAEELATKLEIHPSLTTIEASLAEHPHYTGLYRYDPFTVTTSETWGGASYNGARTAFLRLFTDLTFDKIKVVQDGAVVRVLIDHPSVLISTKGPRESTNEPTVLFDSRTLKISPSDDSEENMFGIEMHHGTHAHEVMASPMVQNNSVALGLFATVREIHEKALSIAATNRQD